MDPEARQMRRSASSPNARSTKYGKAYMQPSCSRVSSSTTGSTCQFEAALLNAWEKLETCVSTTSL